MSVMIVSNNVCCSQHVHVFGYVSAKTVSVGHMPVLLYHSVDCVRYKVVKRCCFVVLYVVVVSLL